MSAMRNKSNICQQKVINLCCARWWEGGKRLKPLAIGTIAQRCIRPPLRWSSLAETGPGPARPNRQEPEGLGSGGEVLSTSVVGGELSAQEMGGRREG